MEIAGVNVFYIVPILVFGPIVFFVLFKAIGIQSLFSLNEEQKELQRKHRALEQVMNAETAKSARFKQPKLTSLKIIGQGLFYIPFILGIGYFSSYPTYEYASEGSAQIKLSLTLLGERKVACRTRSKKELQELSPNMRRAISCPRERHPITVTFLLDGKKVFHKTADPAGLRDDGPSSFYETFMVPAGTHNVQVNIFNGEESVPSDTFIKNVELKSGQAIALTHTAEEGIVIH